MAEEENIDFSLFMDDYLIDCREGFQEITSALLLLNKDLSRIDLLDEVFRVFHTVKSSSKMLNFLDISDFAHTSEDLLDNIRKGQLSLTEDVIELLLNITDTLEKMVEDRAAGKNPGNEPQKVIERIKELSTGGGKPPVENSNLSKSTFIPTIKKIQTVRVDVDLLDSLFNLAGELIITKNRVDTIASGIQIKELKAALDAMGHIIGELQENISAARLVPVDELFQKFPKMVHDLARDAGKKVDFVIEGGDIELDKAVLDSIGDPLIHLLRNAVDHGIESSEVRLRHNKNESGTIKLTTKRSEDNILIEVEDDGAGIDPSRLRDVFVRKGLIEREEAELLGDKDVMELLFKPGFTSMEKVTGVSGRGVGLDVVSTTVRGLSGTADISTQKMEGTRFTLKLPITTAIIRTLLVGIGQFLFAVPSNIVIETFKIKSSDIREIQNEQVLVLRNAVVPFLTLNKALDIPQPDPEEMLALVISRGDGLVCIGVDELVDQIEAIIKPFDPVGRQFKGFSGGTILGDGRVVLLLDIPALVGFDKL